MGMPIYRPCMAHNSAGTKVGAASEGKNPAENLASFMGAGHQDQGISAVTPITTGAAPSLPLMNSIAANGSGRVG